MALDFTETVLSELTHALRSLKPEEVEKFESIIAESNAISCHGMGRSGLNVRAFGMRLLHLGKQVSIVGDTLARPIHEGEVLLLVSASGTSPNLQHVAETAKRCGAKIILVTTSAECLLAKQADCVVTIAAPSKAQTKNGRGSAMPMGSLFEEACHVLFDIVILELMERLHITNDQMLARHANLE